MDGAVIDELQQQVADVLERHGAVAEVHVGRGGDAGDGVAVGLGEDGLAVDLDADDRRLHVLLGHRLSHDLADRVRLHGVLARGDVRSLAGHRTAGRCQRDHEAEHDCAGPDSTLD